MAGEGGRGHIQYGKCVRTKEERVFESVQVRSGRG